MESNLNEFKDEVKQWWVLLLVGIIYVIGALALMFLPISGYVTISLIFSSLVLAGGIFEIAYAILNSNILPSWGWYLAGGIIDLIIGLVLCLYPGLTMEILPYLLAFWFMFKGFSLMGFSLDIKDLDKKNWGWPFIFSILIILFAILILFNPLSGVFYITYMLSFLLLIAGLSKIVISFDLRSVYKKFKKLNK